MLIVNAVVVVAVFKSLLYEIFSFGRKLSSLTENYFLSHEDVKLIKPMNHAISDEILAKEERLPRSKIFHATLPAPGHLVQSRLKIGSRILKVNPAVFAVSRILRLNQALYFLTFLDWFLTFLSRANEVSTGPTCNEVSTGPTCQFLSFRHSVFLSVFPSFRSFFQGV